MTDQTKENKSSEKAEGSNLMKKAGEIDIPPFECAQKTIDPTKDKPDAQNDYKPTKDSEGDQESKLPVTILTGFLGAGKTTLLKNIIENCCPSMRIAVIVNDVAELNIDAKLLKHKTPGYNNNIVQLQNGCICCSKREELLEEVKKMAARKEFDYLIIESSGVSQPMPVAENFSLNIPGMAQFQLSSVAKLDTMVSVIDASTLKFHFETIKNLKELDPKEDSLGDNVPVSFLLVEQIEFSNVIILNKIDLISEDEKQTMIQLFQSMNKDAELVSTTYGKIEDDLIINTGKFNFQNCIYAAGWINEIQNEELKECVIPKPVSVHNVVSFVYRRRKPFHPFRLYNSEFTSFCGYDRGKIVRSKGFCWLATRNDTVAEWSQVGNVFKLSSSGLWYAALTEEDWLLDEEEIVALKKDFHENAEIGDRRQELVFIGIGIRQEDIELCLDKCLLTDEEFDGGVTSWKLYDDPYPLWKNESYNWDFNDIFDPDLDNEDFYLQDDDDDD